MTRILPILLASSLVLAAPAAAAEAEARFYAGAHGGWNFLLGSTDFESDAGYGGAIGVDFDGPAIEVSIQYSKHRASDELLERVPQIVEADAEMTLLALDVNGRYNIDLGVVRPYFLFGVGYYLWNWQATLSAPIDGELEFEDDNNAFGVSLGAGIEIPIGDHLTIGPDVRYHLAFTDEFNSIDEIEDTDLADVPDLLAVTGRVNVYF